MTAGIAAPRARGPSDRRLAGCRAEHRPTVRRIRAAGKPGPIMPPGNGRSVAPLARTRSQSGRHPPRGTLASRLRWLHEPGNAALVRRGLRGVEKESLRVDANGRLSHRPHPRALGAALTHPYLTTDYSESLPEFVTSPQAQQLGDVAVPLRPACVRAPAARRRAAVARQHAVRARRGSRDPDRLLRHLESGPAEDDLPTRSRLSVRPCDAGDRGRALQLFAAGRTLAGLPSARRSARAGRRSFGPPSSWASCATTGATRGS